MVNQVGETIVAFEADPMTKLDVKGLLQLKLSLDENIEEVRRGDSEIGGRRD